MSRYYKKFALPISTAQAKGVIDDFMQRNGFKEYHKNGESCYKKGNGILTGPQFIKILVEETTVTIEAWIKMAILPGVYCGEQDLTGAFGFALKNSLKAKVDYLESRLGFVPGVTPIFMPGYGIPPQAPPPAAAAGARECSGFCPSCGTPARPEDKFCKNCGTAVNRPAEMKE